MSNNLCDLLTFVIAKPSNLTNTCGHFTTQENNDTNQIFMEIYHTLYMYTCNRIIDVVFVLRIHN